MSKILIYLFFKLVCTCSTNGISNKLFILLWKTQKRKERKKLLKVVFNSDNIFFLTFFRPNDAKNDDAKHAHGQ